MRIGDDLDLSTDDDGDRDVSVIIDISAHLEAERLRAIQVARERRHRMQRNLAHVRKRPALDPIPVQLTVYSEPSAKWPLVTILLGIAIGAAILWAIQPVAMVAVDGF